MFTDNFTKLDTTVWTRYSGVPRCCKSTIWSKGHAVASGGMLNLQTYKDPAYSGKWVSGGVSLARSVNLTYGNWQIRFRFDKGTGVGMCIGLWPKTGWPPEVDFAEESSTVGNRSSISATLHYGAKNNLIHKYLSADFSAWHVIGVQWYPGHINYTIDGSTWASISGSEVPNVPMHLFMQTQIGSNGFSGTLPNGTTPAHVNLQVDWVKIYRYAG